MRPALSENQSRDTITTDVVLPDGPARTRNPLLPHYEESCADAARKVASQEASQPSDKDVPVIADALVAQARTAAEGSLAAHMAMLSHVYDSMESASSMLSGDWRASSETVPDSVAEWSGLAAFLPGGRKALEIERRGRSAPGGVANVAQSQPVPVGMHTRAFSGGEELHRLSERAYDANRGSTGAVEYVPSPPSADSLTISISPRSLQRPSYPPTIAPRFLPTGGASDSRPHYRHRVAASKQPPGIPAAEAMGSHPTTDCHSSTRTIQRWGPWWRLSDAGAASASAGRPSTESSIAPSWDARSSSSSESLSRYYMRD
ncbi:hypothetical protein HK405_005509 [Cladochytrium tenue]|nr:hypothetical protein HK405_005509 [Cladochytrium tenue]